MKTEFSSAWDAYKRYAWGHDELEPRSRSYHDWYAGNPFYITAVDALDTMILTGMKDEADATRIYIDSHLSFDKDVYVSVFEFTIRLFGGLLSSYELTGDRQLLLLAKDLADRELPAFASPTGIPYREVNLKTGETRGAVTNPAEAGTLVLEFGTLTQLVGDRRYYNAARRAQDAIYARRSSIGLVGQSLNVNTGAWTGRDSSISGGIDSYYEYLLKCAKLFDDAGCRDMWQTTIPAVNRYLPDQRASGYWYGHVEMDTGNRTATDFGALDAYFPAVLALSGELPLAEKLYDSCLRMWNLHGIEPETLNYVTMRAVDDAYHLRPEIMESTYYLHERSGNAYYLRAGAKLFADLKKYCRLPDGSYDELTNVVTRAKGDLMPSYFLAETLKYLYLLFAPEPPFDFSKVIFTTEAHPLFVGNVVDHASRNGG